MQLRKAYVIKVANKVLMNKRPFTQRDVFRAIEDDLNRKLTRFEKSGITQILRDHYVTVKRVRSQDGIYTYYFVGG